MVLAVLFGGAARVRAHASLARTEPREGSTVRSSPAEVRLWFSEPLDRAFSTLQVVSAAGQRVDQGDGRVDPAAPKQLRVSLPTLPAGTYKVHWRVLSVDTHVTAGEITFRVAP